MNLRERQWIIGGIFLLITVIFWGRLAQMQLFSSEWKAYAARLTEESETLEAARGLLLDRHGRIMVNNQAGYDIWFTPRQCANAGGLDTLELAALLEMSAIELAKEFERAEAYATYRPSIVRKQLSVASYARVAGELWRFPGIQARRRSIRTNPTGLASHLIGEYREVDRNDLEADQGYRSGDYKGKSGLELQWEAVLRGHRGIRHHIVDIRNDYRAPAQSGQLDTMPVPGENLNLTLDLDLQAYGEALMANKRGAIVAIEPATGEILAMISAPSYATNLLTGRERGANYDSLLNHPSKPLFNRTLRATYRPGSIFKMVQGLLALDAGVIAQSSRIPCDRNVIGCHGGHSFDNLEEAVVHSCNPYFHEVMRRMIQGGSSGSVFQVAHENLGTWATSIRRFGFGTDLGGNFPSLRNGTVPDSTDYDRMYGRMRWAYSTIYSIAIGEGELLTTPLHMANLAAILANRGHYIAPHVVRNPTDASVNSNAAISNLERFETGIDPIHFDAIVRAMHAVVTSEEGTGRRARVPNVEVCGKTGTVQTPRGNHSVFIAFAPKDDPKIALSVYVENAGSGGEWAAPIASLLMESYLNDSVSQVDKELRILQATYPFPTVPL